MVKERKDIITFLGNPLTLMGNPVSIGEKAPDFTVLANDLSPRTLSDYANNILILSAVPSLDTGVCDIETQRFNSEAAKLGEKVRILTISCDLPFAQARWCGATGVSAVETLSDHRELSFGYAYGIAIKELRLLARAVFVVDTNGMITYQEIVPEMTHEPNYTAIFEAVNTAS
ncbi:thiol peroxidase [Lawsonia intracellularis]|uniref:Thiol peroxidase n=1 Tax=Lawsonia intracellularis (strain PHE/MN1-00) TaxID=363253 RepID=Q1MQS7_LAWIP|nr:thiol peroxidase [Lawsonia intracellularis]AGC50014.1 redoxin domain protein [Lawsonia intracellularis N343]KAA0204711.1 thiol peroxidase [Lawsonia intracellularis]MBZ3893077.1 thiol peroxidase [Lawsonia intracellularis]OMQ04450.1 2-Cys peroxiredoxin [Lawsonia intracellularis]RBN33376.1 thiol peroxidase [Lawsonia intracellularis]